MKLLSIILVLFFLIGCNPATKFTTYQEYKEESHWDPEKGFVSYPQASWKMEWE